MLRYSEALLRNIEDNDVNLKKICFVFSFSTKHTPVPALLNMMQKYAVTRKDTFPLKILQRDFIKLIPGASLLDKLTDIEAFDDLFSYSKISSIS